MTMEIELHQVPEGTLVTDAAVIKDGKEYLKLDAEEPNLNDSFANILQENQKKGLGLIIAALTTKQDGVNHLLK